MFLRPQWGVAMDCNPLHVRHTGFFSDEEAHDTYELVPAQAEDAALRLRLHRRVSAPTSIRTVLATPSMAGEIKPIDKRGLNISMKLVAHHEIRI